MASYASSLPMLAIVNPFSSRSGTDQTDTLPTDAAEMDKIAEAMAGQDTPTLVVNASGDIDTPAILRKRTLRLGEVDSDEEDGDVPNALDRKPTVDYGKIKKQVGPQTNK